MDVVLEANQMIWKPKAGYCAVIRVAGEEEGSMSETRRNKPGEVRPDFDPTICHTCQPW